MKRPGQNMPAFTLIELLVAVTITALIAGLMLAVSSGLLDLWRRQQSAATQAATARQVFDLLAQDLGAAVARRDTTCWLAVDISDTSAALANHGWALGSARVKPGDGASLRPLPPADEQGTSRLAQARFGLSGVWLRFVTTNIDADGSLPTVVAYQIVRRPVVGDPVPANQAPVRYSLYRSVVSTAGTLTSGNDVTAAAYRSPDNRPFGAGSTQYRAPRNVMNPSHANLLAANAVDFGVWLYGRDSDGALRRVYPAAAGDTSHHAFGASISPDSMYPAVAEVMVRILSEDGAALVEAIEANRVPVRPPRFQSDAEWWWQVVESHSQVFTQRFVIKGGTP